MVALSALMALHAAFDNLYGIGNNLLHYMAMPRIFNKGFKFEEAKRVLFERQHPDKLEVIGMAPQDVSVFKKRASLLANDNEAYRIAVMANPSIPELIKFSYMMPCWSILYPLKHYIMHHMELARDYNGFLPYGSAVIAFVNALNSKPGAVSTTSPSYADHVYLQEISNRESIGLNIPSVEINNMMYLQGIKIRDKGWVAEEK